MGSLGLFCHAVEGGSASTSEALLAGCMAAVAVWSLNGFTPYAAGQVGVHSQGNCEFPWVEDLYQGCDKLVDVQVLGGIVGDFEASIAKAVLWRDMNGAEACTLHAIHAVPTGLKDVVINAGIWQQSLNAAVDTGMLS